MRQRRECLDCSSHTFMAECVNCGSTRLRVVQATRGDVRSVHFPISPGARKWQRDMLETPGIAVPPATQHLPQV